MTHVGQVCLSEGIGLTMVFHCLEDLIGSRSLRWQDHYLVCPLVGLIVDLGLSQSHTFGRVQLRLQFRGCVLLGLERPLGTGGFGF